MGWTKIHTIHSSRNIALGCCIDGVFEDSKDWRVLVHELLTCLSNLGIVAGDHNLELDRGHVDCCCLCYQKLRSVS